jgi:hypothetical protein
LAGSLQTPDFRSCRPKMPKVSGDSLSNSRFPETPVGDWVRSALDGRAYSANSPKLSESAAWKLRTLSLIARRRWHSAQAEFSRRDCTELGISRLDCRATIP